MAAELHAPHRAVVGVLCCLFYGVAGDAVVDGGRADAFRVQAREQVVKRGLYDELKDEGEVERIFLIIKQQREY